MGTRCEDMHGGTKGGRIEGGCDGGGAPWGQAVRCVGAQRGGVEGGCNVGAPHGDTL